MRKNMITSKQNALVKEIRSLSDKKFRDSLNLYVVENVKAVREILALNLKVKVVVGTEKGLSTFSNLAVNTELVSEEVFKYVSTEVTPQGVLAVVEKPMNDLQTPTGSCLLLDGVSNPNNVGAILRTAVASGYSEVYMTSDCADAYSPKSVMSSMSGVFRAKIMRADISQLLDVISMPIIVADMNGENVFNAKIEGDFCLVIGNEGRGVSPEVKEKAQKTVSIPMLGGMESLNAAVSAGILMYNLKNNL